MKEKVCCILDEDEKYVLRLTEYINSRHVIPYRAMAFTSEEALVSCADSYEIELLLAGEDTDWDAIKSVSAGMRIELSEDNCEEENKVYRYQSAEHLLKDVVSHFSFFSKKLTAGDEAAIFSVYSPESKCFKTTCSLVLAAEAAKRGSTLYINLEQFAGLEKILSDKRGGLSEALYFYKIGKENSYGKVISCTDSVSGFDYLAPAICADDISDLTDEEFVDFICMLLKGGNYRYIIIDVGTVFNRPWKLLEISDRIIMPEPFDYAGRSKVMEFEKYLEMSGRSEIKNNISKITIPYNDAFAGYEISLNLISDIEWRSIAGRVLDEC